METSDEKDARDDHEELPKHVKTPVLIVKNDSDNLEQLRKELQKVIEDLSKLFPQRNF